jgi:hypothetical protein
MTSPGDLRWCGFDAIIVAQEAGQSRSRQALNHGIANEGKN